MSAEPRPLLAWVLEELGTCELEARVMTARLRNIADRIERHTAGDPPWSAARHAALRAQAEARAEEEAETERLARLERARMLNAAPGGRDEAIARRTA